MKAAAPSPAMIMMARSERNILIWRGFISVVVLDVGGVWPPARRDGRQGCRTHGGIILRARPEETIDSWPPQHEPDQATARAADCGVGRRPGGRPVSRRGYDAAKGGPQRRRPRAGRASNCARYV